MALVDGNKTQIRLLRRIAKERGIDLTIILDFVHVTEYLWSASRAFHSESGEKLENWVRVRLLEILRGKAGYVAGGIRRSATLRDFTPPERKPVDVCANYLLTYERRSKNGQVWPVEKWPKWAAEKPALYVLPSFLSVRPAFSSWIRFFLFFIPSFCAILKD